jgi:hypothetical protein
MKIEKPLWQTRYFVCSLILIGSITNAMVSAAHTFYVSTSGNDAVSCTTAQNIATPKRTINGGMACMAPGDTLYIRSGTYTEKITWSLECRAEAPCTMAGYPGDARPVIQPKGSYDGILVYKPNTNSSSYVLIKNLDIDALNQSENLSCMGIVMQHTTVENIYCVNAARNGFVVGGNCVGDGCSNYSIIRNNTIVKCGRVQPNSDWDTKGIGIYSVSANSLFEGNLIDGCRGGGIEINYDGNRNSIFRNNTIRNIGILSPWGPVSGTWTGGTGRPTFGRGFAVGGAGVFGPNGPTNNQIYNNIMYNIKGSTGESRCFSFWAGSSSNLIANNICHNVDTSYVVNCFTTHSNTTIQNNIFSQTPIAPNVCGTLKGTITNNLTNPNVSATFVNAPSGDFHLKQGSPAINAGTTIVGIYTDFTGTSRPQGAAYDMGAFEYVEQPFGLPPSPTNLRVINN